MKRLLATLGGLGALSVLNNEFKGDQTLGDMYARLVEADPYTQIVIVVSAGTIYYAIHDLLGSSVHWAWYVLKRKIDARRDRDKTSTTKSGTAEADLVG